MRTSNKKKVEMIKMLKEVVVYNEAILEKVNYDQSAAKGLITMEVDGMSIFNPFLDESLMHIINNPIGYYGYENCLKMTNEFYTKRIAK